jgi:Resolvase, N terminal domain
VAHSWAVGARPCHPLQRSGPGSSSPILMMITRLRSGESSGLKPSRLSFNRSPYLIAPDQDLAIQREALAKAGCALVREEKRSGTSRNGREELELLIGFMRSGDTLMVTRIDRLGRSMKDL